MVLSQHLLLAIEGPLVPLQGLVILALLIDHQGHVVDGDESGRVVLSQRLLTAIGACWYHSRALSYSPCLLNTEAMLRMVARVEGCC